MNTGKLNQKDEQVPVQNAQQSIGMRAGKINQKDEQVLVQNTLVSIAMKAGKLNQKDEQVLVQNTLGSIDKKTTNSMCSMGARLFHLLSSHSVTALILTSIEHILKPN